MEKFTKKQKLHKEVNPTAGTNIETQTVQYALLPSSIQSLKCSKKVATYFIDCFSIVKQSCVRKKNANQTVSQLDFKSQFRKSTYSNQSFTKQQQPKNHRFNNSKLNYCFLFYYYPSTLVGCIPIHDTNLPQVTVLCYAYQTN